MRLVEFVGGSAYCLGDAVTCYLSGNSEAICVSFRHRMLIGKNETSAKDGYSGEGANGGICTVCVLSQ